MLVLLFDQQHSGDSISSDIIAGYRFRIQISKQKQKYLIWAKEMIRIGLLINGAKLSSVRNQDSVYPSVIMAPVSGVSHMGDIMPNA